MLYLCDTTVGLLLWEGKASFTHIVHLGKGKNLNRDQHLHMTDKMQKSLLSGTVEHCPSTGGFVGGLTDLDSAKLMIAACHANPTAFSFMTSCFLYSHVIVLARARTGI